MTRHAAAVEAKICDRRSHSRRQSGPARHTMSPGSALTLGQMATSPERPAELLLLTFTAGSLDALCYLAGHAFTANMTRQHGVARPQRSRSRARPAAAVRDCACRVPGRFWRRSMSVNAAARTVDSGGGSAIRPDDRASAVAHILCTVVRRGAGGDAADQRSGCPRRPKCGRAAAEDLRRNDHVHYGYDDYGRGSVPLAKHRREQRQT
jgi:hypothetical protein